MNSFTVIDRLELDDIGPFVRHYYFGERTWVVWSHYAISLLFIALWIRAGMDAGFGFDAWMMRSGWSVLTFVILLPVHEQIHGVVYRLLGATDVRFGFQLRRMMAYAIAHLHVVSAREFVWVAIMPFLVVTAGIAGALSLFPDARFFLLGILVMHTGGCSGDWAMMNYLWCHRDLELYTYDDAEEGASYFVTPTGGER